MITNFFMQYWGLGDYFPRLQLEIEPGFHYGEGRYDVAEHLRTPLATTNLMPIAGTACMYKGERLLFSQSES